MVLDRVVVPCVVVPFAGAVLSVVVWGVTFLVDIGPSVVVGLPVVVGL